MQRYKNSEGLLANTRLGRMEGRFFFNLMLSYKEDLKNGSAEMTGRSFVLRRAASPAATPKEDKKKGGAEFVPLLPQIQM